MSNCVNLLIELSSNVKKSYGKFGTRFAKPLQTRRHEVRWKQTLPLGCVYFKMLGFPMKLAEEWRRTLMHLVMRKIVF